jgi:hypothetical protein
VVELVENPTIHHEVVVEVVVLMLLVHLEQTVMVMVDEVVMVVAVNHIHG